MATGLVLVCIGCLLQGALCNSFKANVPQEIKVVEGSCVTIPCSFDIPGYHNSNLDRTCKAKWLSEKKNVFDSKSPTNGQLTGDLTKKDCTTTLNRIKSDGNGIYDFRLECRILKFTFAEQHLRISVKAVPQRPKLSPTKLKVIDGTPVTLKCSAPAPCLSHPPNITWTPVLGDIQETIEDQEDKTKVKTSTLNFTVSHLHHRKNISCTANYSKQDGSAASTVSTALTAVVLFSPQILPSSYCTKTPTEVNCTCEALGNPQPTLSWYLDGIHVKNHETFAISTKPLNETVLRSIITVNQSHWKYQSTLVCNSSNTIGSISQLLYNNSYEQETPENTLDEWTLTVFIVTLVGLLLLLCVLAVIIRCPCRPPKNTPMSPFLSSTEENQVPNTEDEKIYVNVNQLRQMDAKVNDDSGVIYSIVTVNCTHNRKQRQWEGDPSNLHLPNSSYTLEMENLYEEIETKRVKKEAECEYSQVVFKDR